jgi:uncharacterized protein
VLYQITRTKQSKLNDIPVEPVGNLAQEPPAQQGRFEKIADWLFIKKDRDRYLLIRSFPFNVIALTSEELRMLRGYLNHETSLPSDFLEILSKHHFLDPEPTAEAYLNEHTSAMLVVTTACNLQCSGCFASGGDYGLGVSHMSNQVIDASIQYLADRITLLYQTEEFKGKSNLGVHFFGGEPLIPIGFDRIRYAVGQAEATAENLTKRFGATITPDFFVTTNGTRLDATVIQFLKDHNFSVLLSIDGPRHDERRTFASGKGSLGLALEAFRALRDRGIRTRLNTVVLGEDVTRFGEILRWFQDEVYDHNPDLELRTYHTFSFQREGPGSPIGDCGTSYAPEQMDKYIKELLDFNSQGYQVYETQLRKKLRSGGTFYKCSSGVKRIAVSPDGRVYPCQGFIDKTFDMGSILDINFQHRSTPISAQLSRRNIAELIPCRNCVFSALCPHNVDCAARSHYTLGGMEVIDVEGMCQVGFKLMDQILFQGEGLWQTI